MANLMRVLFVSILATINANLLTEQQKSRFEAARAKHEEEARAAAIRAAYTCTESTCGGRGICSSDYLNRAVCECFWQFYSGKGCEKVSRTCDPREVKNALPACEEDSGDCVSTYGLNNCRCETDWVGRTCNIYMQGIEADKGFGHVVAMNLEPISGITVDLYPGVVIHGDVTSYKIIIEGVGYDLEISNFYLVNPKEILENVTHLYKNESLFTSNVLWHIPPITHLLIKSSFDEAILHVTYQSTGGRQSMTYSIDYKFKYRGKVGPNECKPSLKLLGGACNPATHYSVGYGLYYKQWYEISVTPYCNITVDKMQSLALYVQKKHWIDPLENLPQIQTQAVLEDSSQFSKHEMRKYIQMSEFGEFIAGTKLLVIGSLTEQLPNWDEDKKAITSTPPAWSYCWMQYLNSDMNPHLFIIPDGGGYLYDCKECKTSVGINVRSLDDPMFDLTTVNNWLTKKFLIQDRDGSNNKAEYFVQFECKSEIEKMKECNITDYIATFFYFGGTYEKNYSKCADAVGVKCPHLINGYSYAQFGHKSPKVDWLYPLTNVYYKFTVLSSENSWARPFFVAELLVDVSIEKHAILKLECIENCGQGLLGHTMGRNFRRFWKDSYLKVDKERHIVMRVVCEAFCDDIDSYGFSWELNGIDYDDPDRGPVFENPITDKYRKYIVTNYPFNAENVVVSIKEKGHRRQVYAKWWFTYFTLKKVNSNEFCEDMVTEGLAVTTQWVLCNSQIETSDYVMNLFLHNGPEFRSKDGVLLGWSNLPKLDDVILPTEFQTQQVLRLVVFNSIGEGTARQQYGFEVHARPPITKFKGVIKHISYLKQLIMGDEKLKITSLAFDMKNYNIFYLIQKMHVAVLELFHLALTDNEEDNMFVLVTKDSMVDVMLQVLSEGEPNSVLEVVQFITVLNEIVFLYEYDLPLDYANTKRLGSALVNLITIFKTEIEDDDYFKGKLNRALNFIEPTLDLFSATTTEPPDEGSLKLTDIPSVRMRINTKDELEPLLFEKDKESYAVYVMADPEIHMKTNNYKDAGLETVKALLVLLKVMEDFVKDAYGYVEPHNKTRNEFVFQPKIELNKEVMQTTRVSMDTYVYIESLLKDALLDEHRRLRIHKEKRAIIVFRNSKALKNITTLMISAIITQGITYWWSPGAKYCVNTAVAVNLKQIKYTQGVSNPKFASRRDLQERVMTPIGYKSILDGTVGENMGALFDTFYYIPDVNQNFRGGETYREYPATFAVSLTQSMPWMIVVVFEHPLEVPLKVVIAPIEPTKSWFSNPKIFQVVGKKTYFASASLGRYRWNDTDVYIGIAPLNERAATYSMTVYALGCVSWEVTQEGSVKNHSFSFNNTCKDPTMSNSFAKKLYDYGVVCTCISNSSELFSAMAVHLEHRRHGFLKIPIDFQMEVSLLVPAVTAVMIVMYLGCLMIAHFMDKRDMARRSPYYLISNRVGDSYRYIIVVITGAEPQATSSSHVGFKIYGTLGNSKRHVLWGIGANRKILKKRRVDWFCLCTDSPLGNIRAVEMWIDNRGPKPHWYCEKIMVRDYNKMREWVFIIQKWFSFIKADNLVHRIHYQTKVKNRTFWQRFLNREEFLLNHLWMGMFVREHCHSLSRVCKVNTVYTITFVGQLWAMIAYGIYELDEYSIADEGTFHLDTAMVHGFMGLLIGVCVVYPLLYFMKNAQPDRHFTYYYSDFSGIDPVEPIAIYPLRYKYRNTALFVMLACKVGSWVFGVLFGFHFGTRKSQMWAISVFTMIIVDAFVVETIHVLARSYFVNCILKLSNAQRFCNEILNLYVEDQRKYATPTIKKQLLKRDMFQPIPHLIKRVLRQKELNFKSFGKSIADFWFFLFLLLNNTILFHFFHVYEGIYSTDIMSKQIIYDNFTQTLPYYEIKHFDDVVFFINTTVLFNTLWRKPGFMVNVDSKLVGVVRLRQIKMMAGNDYCIPPREFEANTITRCEIEFEKWAMDNKAYNMFWTPYNGTTSRLDKYGNAFLYQSPVEAKVFSKMVGYKFVPGGGYLVNLGRTQINSRKILSHLVGTKWFHNTTRYLFVDFVAYSAHANLFNVVCLMMEISMTGDVTKSYTINTIRALETSTARNMLQFFLFAFLALQAFNIIMRHVGQIRYCFQRIQAFQDTLVMTLAFTTLGMYGYRFIRLKMLVEGISSEKLNNYFNIEDVIMLEWWSGLTTGLWCSQNMIHLIDVFHFNSHIRIFYYTILYAMDYILICVVLTIIFLISFSTAFHFIIGQDNILFANFVLAYIQVFAIPFSGHPTMEFSYGTIPSMMPYMIFTFYGYTYRFMITSMFCVIMVNSYHRARFRIYRSSFKYSIVLYIKERILGFRIKFDDDRMLPKDLPKLEGDIKREEEAAIAVEEAEADTGKKGKKKKEKKK